MWKSVNPSAGVAAVLDEDGVEHASPTEINRVLADGWFSTFAKQGCMDPSGHELWSSLPAWSEAADVPSPGTESFIASLFAARPSMCGPHGVPYEAWERAPEVSGKVLFESNCFVSLGAFWVLTSTFRLRFSSPK